MEEYQKIYCSVESCKFNNQNNRCSLSEIKVTPKKNCHTKNITESNCASYECEN